jgi:hypothetical protein
MSESLNMEPEFDTEYKNESVSEVDSESISDTVPFCDHLEESDLEDLITNIHELMEEYFNSEILKMAKPNFHKEMVEDITHIVFQNLLDADICKDSDYFSIFEIVYDHCHTKYNPNFPFSTRILLDYLILYI